MIPTQPSDQIEDFIAFATQLVGASGIEARVGASQADIDRYETLCRHPLPKLLRDYLAEFGESDGGADLGYGAMPNIRRLIRFFEAVSGDAAKGSWDFAKGLLFAFDENGFDRSLLPNGGRIGVGSIVAYSDCGDCIRPWAASLANYLYSSVFTSTRFPGMEPSSLIAGFPTDVKLPVIISALNAVGCRSYWFSDDYQACLEHGPDSLDVIQSTCGVVAYVKCDDPARRLSYRGLFQRDLGAYYIEDGDYKWMAPAPAETRR